MSFASVYCIFCSGLDLVLMHILLFYLDYYQILIGSSDWEDYSCGKQGAEKYRTQNLPSLISCAGVYELGIGISRPQSGRGPRILDSSSVVPVYLGQADNLRNRLQQYGRDGAHLGKEGPGLFTDIFSKGLPIVYRCAPVKSKKEAEITEKQLLDKFDYAWNKGSNGARRQDDIFKKLDRLAKASQFSRLAKKLLFFHPKKVGIKIQTCEPCLSKNGSNLSDMDNNVTFPRIFGIKRLQPRPMQYGSGDIYCTDKCGVAIGDGSLCTTPPVKGRKRCAKHKGRRVDGYISKLNREGKESSVAASIVSGMVSDPHVAGIEGAYTCENPINENFSPICGVVLGDGSPCEKKPFQRNKRCLEHKGRRIGNLSHSWGLTKSHSSSLLMLVDGLTNEIKINLMINALKMGPFADALIRDRPSDMEELMMIAQKYIYVEEMNEIKREERRVQKQLKDKTQGKNQERQGQRDRSRSIDHGRDNYRRRDDYHDLDRRDDRRREECRD
ncbi:hypothetical protein BUALT_Bualt09G0029500 [Buddleja alternifolia]|uniref:GIY-YIG domain-containing protein n=1 Tax=Buddleja alternifolia TaxID=168488 RepID=A0AAV6X827_9LAMI|nr:hypothetical protein BUALT_Bualt09G0029500 [Buddleja alternifolia]